MVDVRTEPIPLCKEPLYSQVFFCTFRDQREKNESPRKTLREGALGVQTLGGRHPEVLRARLRL